MRFINANGTPAEIRNARGEHLLLLDEPLDCAPAAKAMMPYLGWGAQGDIITLKYVDAIACVGRFLVVTADRGEQFTGRLPAAAPLSRVWQDIMAALVDNSKATFGVAMKRFDSAASSIEAARRTIAADEWVFTEDPLVGHIQPPAAGDSWGAACRWVPAAPGG